MRTTRIRHPKLDREVEVPESAAGMWAASGWESADQSTEATAEPDHTEDPPAPGVGEQPAPRTRRTPKESE